MKTCVAAHLMFWQAAVSLTQQSISSLKISLLIQNAGYQVANWNF